VDTTPEKTLKVLGKREDYHEDFCFQDLKKVKIVSIDDYEGSQNP
jgi:hypothetical protein